MRGPFWPPAAGIASHLTDDPASGTTQCNHRPHLSSQPHSQGAQSPSCLEAKSLCPWLPSFGLDPAFPRARCFRLLHNTFQMVQDTVPVDSHPPPSPAILNCLARGGPPAVNTLLSQFAPLKKSSSPYISPQVLPLCDFRCSPGRPECPFSV